MSRAPTRWKCEIPVTFEAGRGAGLARVVDVSDTGLKLEALPEPLPLPGTLLRIQLQGAPGEGQHFHGRVVWLDPWLGRAGVRVFPADRGEAHRFAIWVSDVVLESLARTVR